MNAYSCGLRNSLKIFSLSLSVKASNVHFSSFTAENRKSHSFSLSEKIASCLENCSDTISLKKLHAFVVTQGLEQNTLIGSKIINSYAKFNFLTESRWVFDKLNDANSSPSLWSSIIVGYFRSNQYNEVLEIYLKWRETNIRIHSSGLTFGLKSCVELGTYSFGRNLHTDAFKFGFSCDQFVGSSLIGFYSKCDQIGEATKVFDEITERDMVVYTSMITGFAQAGDHQAKTAFRVAREMQRDGFEPNRVTLISLLQYASRLGSLQEGKSIHGYAIRRGISYIDEASDTSILDMYIKCGDLDRGTTIFDKMNRKTTVSWNALISGHLRLGQPSKAFDLFFRMVHDKNELDSFALANGLLSCADLGYLLIGKAIHCHILRREIHLDLVGKTALVDMYCKCKHLLSAVNIFNRVEEKDGVFFNVMISGYLYNGYQFRAIEIFLEMINKGIRPNIGTIINVLSVLSEMEDMQTAKCIHGYVFRNGLNQNTDLGNQFINIYGKRGLIECARRVFDTMKVKDRVSWTSKMTALVNHGLGSKALTLFWLMQKENLNLDSVTFSILLQALNQLGSINLAREVHGYIYRVFLEKDAALMNTLLTTYSKFGKIEASRNLFEQMSERDLSSWNTMIAAYGMHGDCVPALKLFDQMEQENIRPDEITFKSVLSACSHSGFVQEGLDTFNSMEDKYGIIPSDEHYSCLVDLLGRAGRIEEAYKLLKSAPLRQNGSTLGALLAACRIHGNSEIGERVGKWLLRVEPGNTSAYCSVSNLHAGGERWDEVANIGAVAKRKGLKRTSGYSYVEY